MNRRGTEPYARWCERPGRETSPAYSILPLLGSWNAINSGGSGAEPNGTKLLCA
jgi:hypothetical protein